MLRITELMLKPQRDLVHEGLKRRFPDSTNAELARRDQFMTERLKGFPACALPDDMMPVYQKHLTGNDVGAMTLLLFPCRPEPAGWDGGDDG
jgi:hypothetical protein